MLVFSVLMCPAIAGMMLVMFSRGLTGDVTVVVAFAVVILAGGAVTGLFLRRVRTP